MILRTLSAKTPVNSSGSLPARLPGGLPEGMPAPLRGFPAAPRQSGPSRSPGQRGPNVGQQPALYGPLGPPMDIRKAPREAQVVAYEQGLIPYIPADRAKPTGSEGP